VKTRAARGYLSPLDGRKLPIRSEHSALNVLLQGSAAIIMKRWVVLMMNEVKQRKLDARMLAIIHDEVQAQVAPHHVDEFSFIAIQTIKKAGEYYGLSIPLDGEVKVGNNWAMCH
jgi:DNA polymerase-1